MWDIGGGGGKRDLANYYHKAWESKASQNAHDPEHDIQQSPPKNGEMRHTELKKNRKTTQNKKNVLQGTCSRCCLLLKGNSGMQRGVGESAGSFIRTHKTPGHRVSSAAELIQSALLLKMIAWRAKCD